MLTHAEEKMIKSLHRKKGRRETGKCLVEGKKVIDAAGEDVIDFRFTLYDTDRYNDLVTTTTPQEVAAVATIPVHNKEEIFSHQTVVVLDGVQDPGNVGAIFRLCQGFGASLVLVESADASSPKVIRSSVGSMFNVPWMSMTRPEAHALLTGQSTHQAYRLELTDQAQGVETFTHDKPAMLIVGSEGQGILLSINAPSISIKHDKALESLNVGNAVSIALHERYRSLS
jgi:RNA methyltransferase, TrmH family